jgi:hypothetical protein
MDRASNPYLAYLPLSQVENKAATQYFAGIDASSNRPRWGAELAAQPVLVNPCVGELSVSWNRNLRQWLMLYNCSQPAGIVGHLSDTPWGPWSAPAVLFDPSIDAGTCYFVHGPDNCGPPTDPDSPVSGALGGVYAPFVIPRYTTGGLHSTTIYWTMSTWNPYDVVMMRTTLVVKSQLPFGPDTCKQGFVWREAVPDDHVCVPPATRNLTAQQNQAADGHRASLDGASGPDTCREGFVWRAAFPGDHVCVTPNERQEAAADNVQGVSRRIAP